ncbi:MAG: ribose 5-phosphate isomerase A [Myxococcota bacterium]
MNAERKRAAAAAALPMVRSGMALGLGTGSTVEQLLPLLAAKLQDGGLTDIIGVPTSERTAAMCRSLSIPLRGLDEMPDLDLGIDGADEVAPDLGLIKGLGGALLREKMVASACRSFVVIADARKVVARLGERSALPVEVVPFAWAWHLPFLRAQGAAPVIRRTADGALFMTDNNNVIIDCHFADGIADPAGLAQALSARPGVADHGLFLDLCEVAFIADVDGVRQMNRPD